jgi:hypothetical protein
MRLSQERMSCLGAAFDGEGGRLPIVAGDQRRAVIAPQARRAPRRARHGSWAGSGSLPERRSACSSTTASGARRVSRRTAAAGRTAKASPITRSSRAGHFVHAGNGGRARPACGRDPFRDPPERHDVLVVDRAALRNPLSSSCSCRSLQQADSLLAVGRPFLAASRTVPADRSLPILAIDRAGSGSLNVK